jgi:DNA primase
MIPKEKISDILSQVKILDVISEFEEVSKQGKSFFCTCPECGKTGKGKGLSINPAKNIAKCFSCDVSQPPVDYLMKHQHMTYPDALRYLAEKYGILLEEPKPRERKKQTRSERKSFLERTLEESGLDPDDIKAEVKTSENEWKQVDLFTSGTIDEYNNQTSGDDILIHYYNLHGQRVQYKLKSGNKMRSLWRVRWQNPEAHPLKDGSIGKYKSPYGSGSHLFIPHQVRRMFRDGGHIPTLYIDEGEKKAIKSTKHGMFSLGIMGISNFVQNKQLPHEIQLIVQTCNVKNIVFRVDADVFDLSSNLTFGSEATGRPNSFFKSIIKFRDYVKTLYNLGHYVEIFFAHVVPNEQKEKGVDDVLAGSMKGNEDAFRADSEQAMLSNGQGKYTRLFNLTSSGTLKLKELWGLDSPDSFAKKYRDVLKPIPEFKIFGIKYRINDENKLELAQPLMPEETFWNKTYKNDLPLYSFRYTRAMNFLQNRGFYRFMPAASKFNWIHVENKIVRNLEPWEIRDFVMNTARGLNDEELQDMLIKGGPQYLGPEKLSNLEFYKPQFDRAGKDFQYLYFKDSYWKISADNIEEKNIMNLENYVWKDKIIPFKSSIIDEPLIKITPVDEYIKLLSGEAKKQYSKFKGQHIVKLTPTGEKSQFLRYLRNTSDFSWQKNPGEITPDDRMENYQHLLAKLWAFGYLLHTYFVRSKAKAVIGMDGKLSALGESQGGTGKSIFGFAVGQIIPQFYLDATRKDITDDKFLWDGMTEKHDNCFIDDVRTNFDFKILFNSIEGRWEVQNKGERRFRIPEDETSKIYLTTNNAINGEGNSYKRRQFVIAFSDYYNANRTPADEFGGDLFSDWNQNQWNLFYNMAAQALQVYFRFPEIYVPDERLKRRRLRQMMGEDFLYWAQEYFAYDQESGTGDHVNAPIARKSLTEDFFTAMPREKRFTNANKFKIKIKAYCIYEGLTFNPVQGGKDDKRGGTEYFTIANQKFTNYDH